MVGFWLLWASVPEKNDTKDKVFPRKKCSSPGSASPALCRQPKKCYPLGLTHRTRALFVGRRKRVLWGLCPHGTAAQGQSDQGGNYIHSLLPVARFKGKRYLSNPAMYFRWDREQSMLLWSLGALHFFFLFGLDL